MPMLNSICPVPFDQQPLNEYKFLKQLSLFSWSLMKTTKFVLSIFVIILVINFCSLLITFKYLYIVNPKWLLYLYNFMFATLVLELMLIRVYLGWSYISKRLLSASIVYEESGWYDGQIWIKSANSLIQDRLVGIYEVIPTVIKIKKSIIITSIIFFVEFLLLITTN